MVKLQTIPFPSSPSRQGLSASGPGRAHARTAVTRGMACPFSFLALAGLLALGCSSMPQAPATIELPSDLPTASLDLSIGILPLWVDPSFEQRRAALAEGSEPRRAFTVEPELARRFSREAVEALQGHLQEVRLLQADTDTNLSTLLREAWDAGIDLVLRPALTRHDVLHVATLDGYVRQSPPGGSPTNASALTWCCRLKSMPQHPGERRPS